MTPLFWAKVDIGVIVQRAASNPFMPSARMPPIGVNSIDMAAAQRTLDSRLELLAFHFEV
jgi:hypothetical protein